MNAIKSVVKNGRIEADAPSDWPEGCEVIIERALPATRAGMREEDWPTTPEGIAALLARMDQTEPLEITPEEEADIAAWRRRVKEYTIANLEQKRSSW